jgi:hypothetical protein
MPLASLESFHPRRSSCLADNTKLTRREATHFIATAIAVEEEDGSEEEEEKGLEEGIEDIASPGGLCCERLQSLRSAISDNKGPLGTG